MKELRLIAAVADNGIIGARGELPWRQQADLQNFKKLTYNHAIIMGRRTFESVGPLRDRVSVVMSTQEPPSSPRANVFWVPSKERALDIAYRLDSCPFVIGGAQIYNEMMPDASCIYLTKIHAEPEGDTHFPMLPYWDSPNFHICDWKIEYETARNPADDRNDYDWTFEIYRRVRN